MGQWKRVAVAATAGLGTVALAAGTAVPAQATQAPRHTTTVWVKDCPTAAFTRHPAKFMVACADDNTYFTHLVWSGWGTPRAVGRGTLWANTCTPYCAAGKFVSEPGTLTLRDVARRAGRETYGHAYVQPLPPNKHQERAFGYVLSYRR